MKKVSDMYYKNRHACFLLRYHLVLITKYRKPVLTEDIDLFVKDYAEKYFTNNSCNILKIESNKDHIHIFFEAPATAQLANLINGFKTVSSRMVRNRFSELLSNYYWKPYFWSRSYFITTVSANITKIVNEYIKKEKD